MENETKTIKITQDDKTDIIIQDKYGEIISINGNKVIVYNQIENNSLKSKNEWVYRISQKPLGGVDSNYVSDKVTKEGTVYFEGLIATLTIATISYFLWTYISLILIMGGIAADIPTFINVFCDTAAAKISTMAVSHAPNVNAVTYVQTRSTDLSVNVPLNNYYKYVIKYYISGEYVPGADFLYYVQETYN